MFESLQRKFQVCTAVAAFSALSLPQSVSGGPIFDFDANIRHKSGHEILPQASNPLLSLREMDFDELDSNDLPAAGEDIQGSKALQDWDPASGIVDTKDIFNYFNLQITTKLYIGSNQEEHDLILDTGSMWTWVQTEHCWSCATHNNFDTKASTSWKPLEEADGRMMATGYGSGAVFGFAGTDKVCLQPNKFCAENHKMSAVVAETGLDTLAADGILGLGPDTLTDMPKLFIDSLHEQGVIEQRTFAFLVGLERNLPSKFMVGGYDLHKYAKGPIQWHDTLEPKQTWYLDWTGVSFGEHTLHLDPTVMLPDTGTSFISLPERTMEHLLAIMHEEFGTEKPKLYPVGLWGARCSLESYEAMPDLTFMIDQTAYVISKKQYMANRNGHCVLQIAPTGNTGKAYLGINFFENYYGIFDMDNKRVGFAESVYSELTSEESAAHNRQVLLNMSSYEELEYFFESAGFKKYGPEILLCCLGVISIFLGYYLAKFFVNGPSAEDQEAKAARKALAAVLKETNKQKVSVAVECEDDEMFDVPLVSDSTKRSTYTSPSFLNKSSNSSQNSQKEKAQKVPLLEEDDEYTFDVEL